MTRSFALFHPLLRQAAMAACALFALGSAQAQTFGLDNVARIAQALAQRPFTPSGDTLPPALRDLSYDQARDIRFRPETALWRKSAAPFEAMLFHPARQAETVRIHEVVQSSNMVRPLRYEPAQFDYGKNQLDLSTWQNPAVAGFRIHYPLNNPAYKDELAVFLGASYFRMLGAGQQYGLSARGLAIDTAGAPGPEEFPRFTEFWLEQPEAADAKAVVVYALLESPRATGAYRFAITPGTETVAEVQARVFPRVGAGPIATLGLAPLTSMFLFGENQPSRTDFRPEVHDSDGLSIATGSGEWIWRPLGRPKAPIATAFAMGSLKGFGLMQRDRQFANYEDTEARYERRPSAWVEPIGEWGPGRVELLQLPTPDETHDNIAAYWVPAVQPQPGKPLDFAYRIRWQGDAETRPPAGRVLQTRRGIGYHELPPDVLARTVQYVVDFGGPQLDLLGAGEPVRAIATADANGRVAETLLYRNPVTNTWRMTLRVERLDAQRPLELRAFLQHGDHVLSETWSHIVLPE